MEPPSAIAKNEFELQQTLIKQALENAKNHSISIQMQKQKTDNTPALREETKKID